MFDTNIPTSFMDVPAAAKRLHVSEHTMRRLVYSKQIAHIRVGMGHGRVVFSDDHIADYLARRTVQPEQAPEAA